MPIKPLDFVRTKGTVTRRWDSEQKPITEQVSTDNIGIVTEVSLPTPNRPWMQASVVWIDRNPDVSNGLFNACWHEDDLIVLNNLPNLLTKAMAHPFGNNQIGADIIFPIGLPNFIPKVPE